MAEHKQHIDEYLLSQLEDFQRVTIVYDIDGPIGVSEYDHAWLSLLMATKTEDKFDLNWINISELNTARVIREALDRFISKKEKALCQKDQKSV